LTTNLRLLLDECITNPLAEMLRDSSSALNIAYIHDLGMSSTPDSGVMEYATREDRIVVTTDTGINHKKFKICKHPGIIVLRGGHRHESLLAGTFRKFMLSGHRAETYHKVTFLSEGEARIKASNDGSIPDKVIRL